MIAALVDNGRLVLRHPKHAFPSYFFRKDRADLAVEVRIQHPSIGKPKSRVIDICDGDESIEKQQGLAYLRREKQGEVLLHFREVVDLDDGVPV